MVHCLGGHQAVFLPVHHPQVRGWASLTTPCPLGLSPEPSTRYHMKRHHILLVLSQMLGKKAGQTEKTG